MKTMLFITLCSYNANVCMPPIEGGVYDDWYLCAKEGYTKGFEVLENIGIEKVNKNKYYVSFKCSEVKYEGV